MKNLRCGHVCCSCERLLRWCCRFWQWTKKDLIDVTKRLSLVVIPSRELLLIVDLQLHFALGHAEHCRPQWLACMTATREERLMHGAKMHRQRCKQWVRHHSNALHCVVLAHFAVFSLFCILQFGSMMSHFIVHRRMQLVLSVNVLAQKVMVYWQTGK